MGGDAASLVRLAIDFSGGGVKKWGDASAKMLDKKVIEHYDKYQVEIPPCNWQVYPAFFF